ncbi:MAG: ribbon-helix-helix protein, CopG family [bacterium]|nr:ribbon-helix-helix protein, CopG family [bacterium]
MVRTQIQLREDQATALKELAVAEGRSMADLIRGSVDSLLQSKAYRRREDQKRRAIAAIGRFRSGVSDLSSEHDRYLSEACGD